MTSETNPRTRQRTWARVLLRVTVLTVVLLGLVAFSVLLAKVTLTPSPASEDIVTSNLQPGRSLRQYAEDYTFLAACKQAGGNLLLGVPFGLLLPFLVPRRLRMISMTLLTAAVMVLVELVQGALVTGRAFDIDDVILNTAGALLGYFLLGRRISHSYHAHAHTPRAEAVKPTAEPKTTERTTPSRTKAKAGTTKTGTKAGATKAGTTRTWANPRGTAKAKEPSKAGARAGGTRLTKARGSSGRPTVGGARPGSGRALLDRLRRR
ncbi:VanZ family protein [Streptomyces sp. SID8374]|uniref:VanZ family protein n=1 Tax=Streptomyces sp. SID8374 TaxID=2690354 RepID=UPI00136C5CA1|nr:VanZ family protein [Streptomyces sp. SID8374]MYX11886.1 VanZ family protein [Streptomyces sp. SID8374]